MYGSKRFCRTKKIHTGLRAILSIVIFLLIICIFFGSVTSLSNRTCAEEKQSLETALQQGVTRCYAQEGRYPESLDYLKEKYGISYDSSHYYVDYQILGSNLMPDITIIAK